MTHYPKQGFLSSLFRRKADTGQAEAAQLESKRRLEERIRLILADRVESPELLMNQVESVAVLTKHEEIATEIELLPITASVITSLPMPVRSSRIISSFEAPHAFAVNER